MELKGRFGSTNCGGSPVLNSLADTQTEIYIFRITLAPLSAQEAQDLNLDGANLQPDQTLELDDMSIFPNPGDGHFTISFALETKGDLTVRIVNLEGKTVFTDKMGGFEGAYAKNIDLSAQPSGTYVVEAVQNGKGKTWKILIQK